MGNIVAYRGSIFYFKDSASLTNLPTRKTDFLNSDSNTQYVYIKDGLLIVENGLIKEVGDYDTLKNYLTDIKLVNYKNKLLTPGFIDTHQHATQSLIVASYGDHLIAWLKDYVFASESTYKDSDTVQRKFSFFLDELLRNGTTTAASYGSLFYDASEIFFEEINKRNMLFITGNILMDMNSPDNLKLTPKNNYNNAVKLIQNWHKKNRILYCISPRFALSCSEEMLTLCSSLKKEYPELYIQTHLSEDLEEIDAVKKIYPWSKTYLDVYDHFGLVGDQTIFGHCIYLKNNELIRLKEAGSIISWCPLSNNFLGSGMFDFAKTKDYCNKITLGTDWGAGNSLSMLSVMGEAYKVSMLNNYRIPVMHLWFLCTLGTAKALQIDDKIGNFKPGKAADFIVVDPYASPFLRHRLEKNENIFEILFVLIMTGNDRNIHATYIYGKPEYKCSTT